MNTSLNTSKNDIGAVNRLTQYSKNSKLVISKQEKEEKENLNKSLRASMTSFMRQSLKDLKNDQSFRNSMKQKNMRISNQKQGGAK